MQHLLLFLIIQIKHLAAGNHRRLIAASRSARLLSNPRLLRFTRMVCLAGFEKAGLLIKVWSTVSLLFSKSNLLNVWPARQTWADEERLVRLAMVFRAVTRE